MGKLKLSGTKFKLGQLVYMRGTNYDILKKMSDVILRKWNETIANEDHYLKDVDNDDLDIGKSKEVPSKDIIKEYKIVNITLGVDANGEVEITRISIKNELDSDTIDILIDIENTLFLTREKCYKNYMREVEYV